MEYPVHPLQVSEKALQHKAIAWVVKSHADAKARRTHSVAYLVCFRQHLSRQLTQPVKKNRTFGAIAITFNIYDICLN